MIILGLDVGSRWMKGTVLNRGMLGYALVHAFRRPVTPAPIAEQVTAALNEEARGVDLLVLSIPREQITTRNASVPFKDLKKVKMVVPGVAEQNLPFRLADAVPRHLITDETAPGQTHFLLLVAKKADLALVSATLAAQRVNEATAAIDSLGVANAFLAEVPDAKGTLCIDVGARKTSIEVVHQGRLVFSRVVMLAGDAFTAAIAAKLKVSADEAEKLKCALGAPDASETPRAHEVRAALAEAYKRLGRDLKQTVLAARNLWPTMEIAGVRLTGGSAIAAGLVDAVGESTGLATQVFAPRLLAGTAVGGEPSMAGAVGLALTGVRKAKIEVDFLERPRDIVRFHRKEIGLVMALLVVLLMGSWASARRELAMLRTEDEEADRDIAGGLGRIAELKQPVTKANIDTGANRLRKLQSILSEDTSSRLYLVNEIAKSLPEGDTVSFRSLTIEKGSVELEGETDSFETVQKLEDALKKGLQRAVEVQPPRNEMRDEKTITVFRLKLPAEAK